MKTNHNIAEEITGELGHVGQRTKTDYYEDVTELCRREHGDFVWDDDLCVVRWTFFDGSRLVIAMDWWALAENYDG
jgi:hypothetical protein